MSTSYANTDTEMPEQANRRPLKIVRATLQTFRRRKGIGSFGIITILLAVSYSIYAQMAHNLGSALHLLQNLSVVSRTHTTDKQQTNNGLPPPKREQLRAGFDSTTTPTTSAVGNQSSTRVTVNGQDIPIQANGTTVKSTTDENSHVSVNVSTQNSISGSTESTTNNSTTSIRIKSRTTTQTEDSEPSP